MRLIIFAILLFLSTLLSAQINSVQDLSAIDFYNTMDTCQQKIIINVSPINRNKYSIEGEIKAPDSETLKSIIDTLDTDTPIFVFCNEGERGKSAGEIIAKKEFKYIFNLQQGINDYYKHDFPVIKVKK